MNKIRQIKELNQRELEAGISPDASWHTDYRDTAYVYIGGLPFELSEGDVITIFSQYGEPTFINLVRDKETGKSRGFAFLKYEDQRSTDLAVDNLGGAVILGKTLSVDHTRYKRKDEEEGMDLRDESGRIEIGDASRRKRQRTDESESEEERPMLKEERELAKLVQDHDEEDPMKAFLVQEKREEVEMALAKVKDNKISEKSRKHRHRHHKSRRDRDEGENLDASRSSRRREEGREGPRQRRSSRARDESPGKNGKYRDRSPRLEGNRDRERSPRRAVSRDRYRKEAGRGNEPERRRREDSSSERRRYSRRDS